MEGTITGVYCFELLDILDRLPRDTVTPDDQTTLLHYSAKYSLTLDKRTPITEENSEQFVDILAKIFPSLNFSRGTGKIFVTYPEDTCMKTLKNVFEFY